MKRKVLLLALGLCIPVFAWAQSFTSKTVSSSVLNSVVMVNTTIGYAAGVDGIFKTTDGGQDWSLLPYFVSTLPMGQAEQFTFFITTSLHFENANVGYAAGRNALTNSEQIIKTIDGGATWQIQHNVNPNTDPFQVPEERLSDITVLPSGIGFSIGHYGRLLKSTDGNTWQAVDLSTSASLSTIHFVDNSNGFIGGENLFAKSTDGGATWQKSVTTYSISDHYFFDASTGIAVCGDGRILKTVDGGVSWQENLFRSAFRLNDVTFVSPTVGFISASNAIYKTVDGGTTWLNVFESDFGFSEGSFVSTQDGYFSDLKGRVWITHNGADKTVFSPLASNINPLFGSEGSVVTITGQNLLNVTGVTFNGLPTGFTFANGVVLATVPTNVSTGKVKLQWPGGEIMFPTDFVVSLAPFVQTPTPAVHINQYPLLVKGNNLQFINSVKLNGREMPFTVIDNRTLSIAVESDLPETNYSILVESPHGTSTISSIFIGSIPNVQSIEYELVPAIGKSLTFTGQNLGAITKVEFPGIAAVPVNIQPGEASFSLMIPPNAQSGRIKFHHMFGYVESNYVIHILAPPVINSITPLSASAGDVVHINGTNFELFNFIPFIRLGTQVVHDYEVISKDQIDIRVPPGDGVFPISVQLYGGTAISSQALTVTGALSPRISRLSPDMADYGKRVTVFGVFPDPDSVKLGNRKVIFNKVYPNQLYFNVPPGSVSDFVSIYFSGQVIISVQRLIVTDFIKPEILDFYPRISSPGSYVQVAAQFFNQGDPTQVDEVEEFSMNGVPLIREYGDVIGQVSGQFRAVGLLPGNYPYTVKIPAGVTTGKIKLKTKFGEVYSNDELMIQPNSPPIISGFHKYTDPSNGDYIRMVGRNLSLVDKVSFDNVSAMLVTQTSDSLVVKIPNIGDYGIFKTKKLIVHSPHGETVMGYEMFAGLQREIVSVVPLNAERGTPITITFEPKKSYIPVANYADFPIFYFNGIKATKSEKINDEQYWVEVPLSGNVNGKISVDYSYLKSTKVFYPNDFQLTEPAYCSAVVPGTALAQIIRVALGRFENNTPVTETQTYTDYTANPIKVSSGQRLLLEVMTQGYGAHAGVYVDWNQDLDFEDEGEALIESGFLGAGTDTTVIRKFIKVPVLPDANVPLTTRMRVSLNTNSFERAKPCGVMGYSTINYEMIVGEVEDYTLQVVQDFIPKIYDFYPKIVRTGDSLFISGEEMGGFTLMEVGGIELPPQSGLSWYQPIIVPAGATTGKIVLKNSIGDMVAESQVDLVVNDAIPPVDVTYSNLYRATQGGKDIPFSYYTNYFQLFHSVDPIVPPDATDGKFCLYGSGGSTCSSPMVYPPEIESFGPDFLYPKQKFTLNGLYLNNVTKVKINGTVAPFALMSAKKLEITVPNGATTGKIELITKNGSTSSIQDITVISEPCVGTTSTLPVDIIKVEAGNFSHATIGKVYQNPLSADDFRYSDYTKVNINALAGTQLEITLTLKNFDRTVNFVMPHLFVDWNDDDDFFDSNEHFAGELKKLEWNGTATTAVYLDVPSNVADMTSVKLRINLNSHTVNPYSLSELRNISEPCNGAGETEDYTLVIMPSGGSANTSITDFSPKNANVGNLIQVIGTNFNTVNKVTLNGLNVSFTVVDNEHFRFNIPSGATSGKIIVYDSQGYASSASVLTVSPAFSISSFTPTNGRAGDEITINGSTFNTVTAVAFNGVASPEFVKINNTKLVAKVPEGAGDGFITFLDQNGSRKSSTGQFSYCPGSTLFPCKQDQTIYMNSYLPMKAGDSFPLVAVATSNLPITFTSSDPTIAEVQGGKIIAKKPGEVFITATQSGDATYFSVSYYKTLTVIKGQAVITFNPFQPVTYGNPAFTAQVSSNSPSPIVLQSGNTNVATVSGNVITIVGVGSAQITATQAESDSFFAALPVYQTLVVSKKIQTIDFPLLSSKIFGDLPFDIAASSSSALPVTFQSSNSSIATIVGSQVTIHKAGSVQITANQIGNANYAPASVSQTLVIEKKGQAISFDPIATKTFGDLAFAVSATSTSGLQTAFQSSDLSIATVSGNMITIVGAGTVQIIAEQNGNENYLIATPVQQDLLINKMQQIISFPVIATKTFGDAPFDALATAAPGLVVQFSTSSPNISISGSTVTLINSGAAIITASQPGNDNVEAATPIEQIFCVNPPKPIIAATENQNGITLTSSAAVGNQWYRNGELIAGATGNSYSQPEEGSYSVRVTVSQCESALSDALVVLVTGIDDEKIVINLYPNPVTRFLEIETSKAESLRSLKVFDLQGKEVIRIDHLNSKAIIDLIDIASGQYIMELETVKGLFRTRFIRQ